MIDLGLFFDCAHRISLGEVPYKDFFIVTAPLTYGVLAVCLKLFGQFYLVSRIYLALQCALLVALTFLFCARALKLGKAQCVILAVFQAIWSPQMMVGVFWYDNDSTFLTLLAGIFLLRAWSQPNSLLRWSFLGGVSCALAFWFKQDSGAGAIAGGLLVATFDGGARRHWLAFASGIAAVFSAAGLYFLVHGAFGDMVFWTVRRALHFKLTSGELASLSLSLEQNPSILSFLLSPFTTPIDRSSKFVLMIYFLAPASAWYRFRISRDRQELALFGITLMWALSFYAGLVTHAGQGYTNKVSTFGSILGILWRPWPPGSPALLRSRFGAMAFALGVAIIGLRGAHYHGNTSISGLATFPLQSPRLVGMQVSENLKPLDRLIDYIDRNVAPDEDFLMFDYIITYFATQRKNPHPVADPNAMLPEDEALILERLRRQHNIRWYFYLGGPEDFSRALELGQGKVKGYQLQAYVKEHFRFLESRDGFTVWVRKGAAPG